MNIGVLGAGNVGRTLGSGFLKLDHQVMLGSRDPRKKELVDWVQQNSGAKAGTLEETARFGETILIAVEGRAAAAAIELAGKTNFAGKTVIDATNPIAAGPPVDGILPFFTGPGESLGEQIQAQIPDAHVVKAFNSVGAALMVNPHLEQGTPTMFLCGNNADAKAQVAEIIRQFAWEPYDCGSIVASRAIEPLCMLWVSRGMQHNEWHHAFKLLTR